MKAPSPPGGGALLGHLLPFRKDPLRFLLDARRECGDVVRIRFLWLTAHLLFHPDHVRHVLHAPETYTKDLPSYHRTKVFLGNGLVTSEGDSWRRQRRILQPTFHPEALAGYGPAIVRAAREMVDGWPAGSAIDLDAEMGHLTFRIAAETLLSAGSPDDVRILSEAFAVVQAELARRMTDPFRAGVLPTPARRRFHEAIRTMDEVVYRHLARRRREPGAPDLLQRLVDARDVETGEAMSDRQIRDEVMTMLIAGHETSAKALLWTFHALAGDEPARRTLHSELDAILPDRDPTALDLPRLPWTRAVVHESLRLYPPAWVIPRRVARDDEVGGVRLPKGSLVVLSPWATQRHPEFWPDPERFDPSRWTAESDPRRTGYRFFPFSAGPRVCIGDRFALQELQLVLAVVARTRHLEPESDRPVEMVAENTIRPRGGLRMKVLDRRPAPNRA